jgi:FkbH-like protein
MKAMKSAQDAHPSHVRSNRSSDNSDPRHAFGTLIKRTRIALPAVLMYSYHLFAFPVIAALLLAHVCTSLFGLSTATTPFTWILISPLLYVAWLTLTFCVSALNMQIAAFLGWKKPRRAFSFDENDQHSKQTIVCAAIMMRAILFWSLPVTRYMLRLPILSKLVLYSYSPKVFLGRECQIWGYLYDPDLTTIGERAVIGGGTAVSAHSMTTDQDGRLVYTTAPIHIGPRAVIGGESRIALGVRIGTDAIVEAGSVVAPFTSIPDGEIWAGNPATFQRHRFSATAIDRSDKDDQSLSGSSQHVGTASDEDEAALRLIIAQNIDAPVSDIRDDSSAADYSNWDSLAQLGIAASVRDRFGIELSAAHSFQLTSLVQLRDAIFGLNDIHQLNPTSPTVAPTETEFSELPLDAELLPLFDQTLVTRELSKRFSQHAPEDYARFQAVKIRIASTFTAEPIESSLKTWCHAFEIAPSISFAGFDQVEQSLLDPDSGFRSSGINVILVRPEDVFEKDGRVDSLLSVIQEFGDHASGSLIVATLPSVVSSFFSMDRSKVDRLRSHWQTELTKMPHVELLDFAAVVERIGVGASRQSDSEVVSRSPYSPAVFQGLASELARHVRKHFRPARKVLALDADNTLWGGIVGEDGIDGIQLGDDHPGRSFRLFQQSIRQLKEQGVLLVLVSRNQERDVLQVLNEHPEMLLQDRDFVASRINWQPKSQNLKELAEELNLGLDAFVFVDDDPANRAEVAANAPGVTVLPLPTDAAGYCEALGSLWCFDGLAQTAEDESRTEMMHQQRARQAVKSEFVDLASYLASLSIQAVMRPATELELPRVAQLIQKTNQFNLSLKRRTFDEVRAIDSNATLFTINAADRFGDYGLVGVVIVRAVTNDSLEIDTFLLSCRALGRSLETLILRELIHFAKNQKLTKIIAPFVTGPRNAPVLEFFTNAGFGKQADHFAAMTSLEIRASESVDWIFQEHSESTRDVA